MVELTEEKTVTARLQMPIGCNRNQLDAWRAPRIHQLNIGVAP
jgi:hypothetical protein